jgi:hypothetical protein
MYFGNDPVMRRGSIKYLFLLALAAGFLWSCRKVEHYPPEPQISFTDFILRDSVDYLGNRILTGILSFHFIDGDGDLGMPELDSLLPGTPSSSNLFFTLYYLNNNVLVPADEDDVKTPLTYRIPYIKMTGRDKTMKGEIKVIFFYINFPYDTIKYSFYVVDRAGHESNTAETPLLLLPADEDLH